MDNKPATTLRQTKNPMKADKALELILEKYDFHTLLDVGSGEGKQTKLFRDAGKRVTTLNLDEFLGHTPNIMGDYLETTFDEKFDCVWVSHVLEHQRNAGLFIEKIFEDLKPGGIFAITVPPLKHQIVGGHLTLWNGGLLLYNFIMAGFDCSQAMILQYDYNISIVGRKKAAQIPDSLIYDEGDIERLAPFFPFEARQDFDGQIQSLNWTTDKDKLPIVGPLLPLGSRLNLGYFEEIDSEWEEAVSLALDTISTTGSVDVITANNESILSKMASLKLPYREITHYIGQADKNSPVRSQKDNVNYEHGDIANNRIARQNEDKIAYSAFIVDCDGIANIKSIVDSLLAGISQETLICLRYQDDPKGLLDAISRHGNLRLRPGYSGEDYIILYVDLG